MSFTKYLSLFLISALLLVNNQLQASTDNSCQKAMKGFLNSSPARLVAQPGSVFHKYPQLVAKMEKLHHSELNYVMFVAEFTKFYKKPPTIREGLHYIYQYQRQFFKNYVWLIKEIENMNDPLLENFKLEIIKTKNKNDYYKTFRDLENVAGGFAHNLGISLDETLVVEQQKYIYAPHHRILVETSRINYLNAEFGELYALATTGNRIMSRDMHFSLQPNRQPNAYEQMILKAVNDLEVRFHNASLRDLIDLVKMHHNGFFRKAYGYLKHTNRAQVNKNHLISLMMTMVRSKEIDIVSTKDGKIFYWTEVKALAKPITYKSLMDHPSHKPMYAQLLEHKILRDLLGLENHVQLVFTSTTSRIAPDAVAALNELGYIAVGAR